MKRVVLSLVCVMTLMLIVSCKNERDNKLIEEADTQTKESVITLDASLDDKEMSYTVDESDDMTKSNTDLQQGGAVMEYKTFQLTKAYRTGNYTNPIFTQHFGADPYAMEYDGRVYLYMTADSFEYEADGSVKENSYSKIKTLYVVSTDDMINFTDHGEVKVAGKDGAATWAHNSWAPAACHKTINGEEKFFLYFADNGGGIGVLEADSPVGPFKDPLGHALISRDVPNCADVLWLFDPAVLVDDDGCGYLYFGGGVPEGKVADPGTGRAVKLGEDMISLDGDPVRLDIPYLFEDSGIHKFGNKYYYTYCSNWQVDAEGTAKYGFTNAEICMMESDSPLGPFEFKEVILANPGRKFGLYGNNHHCVFSFLGEWYIAYHARTLEKKMGIEHGYRSTHIDCVHIAEDGSIGRIEQTDNGRTQLKNVDPYSENTAVNASLMVGTVASPLDKISKHYGSGDMFLDEIDTGDYIKISGVDFGSNAPAKIIIEAANTKEDTEIYFAVDLPKNTPFVGIRTGASGKEEFSTYTADISTEVTGVHDLYIVCANGEGVQMKSWKLVK